MDGQINIFGKEEKSEKNDPNHTYEERMKRFWHYWNNKAAKENQIETCEGELRIIVDALADYYDYASRYIEEMEGYAKAAWENRIEKIRKIQSKIEQSIGYDRDKQLEKCQKKRKENNDDVGEDAIVLALKRGKTDGKNKNGCKEASARTSVHSGSV